MPVVRQHDEEQCLKPLVASHTVNIIPLETERSDELPRNIALSGAPQSVQRRLREANPFLLLLVMLVLLSLDDPFLALGVIIVFCIPLALAFCFGLVDRIFEEPTCSYGENCRVKSVEFHSEQPWVLLAQYDGKVYLWKFREENSPQTQFSVSKRPVRVAKFIERKEWLVTASDDMHLRVFSYRGEQLQDFEAHSDYIRSVEVHPTLPYIITASDDMMIRIWDMEYNFACICNFEAHTHYVMQIKLNPKDTGTFASASLDQTVKIWKVQDVEVGASGVEDAWLGTPDVTLVGHESGVNTIDYHPGDEPYLVSGSDDRTVKLWNYETQTLVCSIPGHTHNVTAVLFHPTLPILASASEDGTCILWNSQTHRFVQQLDHDRGRAWSLAFSPRQKKFVISYDKGVVCMNLQETKDDKVVEVWEDKAWSSNS